MGKAGLLTQAPGSVPCPAFRAGTLRGPSTWAHSEIRATLGSHLDLL